MKIHTFQICLRFQTYDITISHLSVFKINIFAWYKIIKIYLTLKYSYKSHASLKTSVCIF